MRINLYYDGLIFYMFLLYLLAENKTIIKRRKIMEPFIVFGICCLTILFLSGSLNGAYDQLDYYKPTLYSESRIPQILMWVAIIFTWGMIAASVANIIWLISMGHPEYCISFFVAGLACLFIGLPMGMTIIDKITRATCKERGINFMPRCP